MNEVNREIKELQTKIQIGIVRYNQLNLVYAQKYEEYESIMDEEMGNCGD